MRPFSIAVVLMLAGAAAPGQDLPQWVLSLSKAKRLARTELERVPNYACRETMARFQKRPGATAFKPLDTLRLEVAFISGNEMFAPEGASQFQAVDLAAFASEGAVGTGTFTSIARNLFVNDAARTTGWGEEKLGDRDTLWYGFVISGMRDPLKLQNKGREGSAGEGGKFWVDAKTLELLRIEDHAIDIPLYLELRAVVTTITYGRVPIGTSDILLPQMAETVVEDLSGRVDRDVIQFSQCREYTSQTSIRFGPDEPEAAPPAPKKK